MKTDLNTAPRVYVSTYAKYAAGSLKGQGIDLDGHDRKLWAMACEAYGYAVTFSQAQDGFSGTADSGADFAEELAEESGAVPKDFPIWISIDWEATWDRNLRYDYATAEDSDGTLWFFHNC